MKSLGWSLVASLALHAVFLMVCPAPDPVPPRLISGRRAVVVNLSAGPKTSKRGTIPGARGVQKPPSPEKGQSHGLLKPTVSKPKASHGLSPAKRKKARPHAPSVPLETAMTKNISKTKPVIPEHADADVSPAMTGTAADLKPPVRPSSLSQANPPANAAPVGATADSANKGEENQSEAVDHGGVDGPTVIKAVPLYRLNPPPPYPRLARRRGLEGKVLMDVLVGVDGKVLDIKITQSSGYRILDRASLKTVQTWCFEPARLRGNAIAMWVEVPIRFRLRAQ